MVGAGRRPVAQMLAYQGLRLPLGSTTGTIPHLQQHALICMACLDALKG